MTRKPDGLELSAWTEHVERSATMAINKTRGREFDNVRIVLKKQANGTMQRPREY